MAVCLRNINKFPNFTNILISRNCTCLEKIYWQFSKRKVDSQCEQYSVRLNSKLSTTTENYQTSVVDHRESVYDTVTRDDLFTLEHLKKDEINIYLRLSRPLFDVIENNEHLFSENGGVPSNKPSPEQLHHVYTVLAETLPNLFLKSLDYSIYHSDLIFEDNIRNIKIVGLPNYMRQVALLKTIGHLKFAFVKFTILKITKNPEDSSVKVRWHIKGISALQIILQFWKYKLWDLRKLFEKTDNWYDGFSTFYINSEGKVIKHVADKMMPDADNVSVNKSPLENAAKLALILGIIPKFSDLNP